MTRRLSTGGGRRQAVRSMSPESSQGQAAEGARRAPRGRMRPDQCGNRPEWRSVTPWWHATTRGFLSPLRNLRSRKALVRFDVTTCIVIPWPQLEAADKLAANRAPFVTVPGIRIDQGQWHNFKAGKKFRHIPEFQGLKVAALRHVGTVPQGNSAVVIRNSENLVNSMTVRVKIVADPE